MDDKNSQDPRDDLTKLKELKARFATMSDLGAAASLLHWDQETYMPPQAVGLRSEQLATLSRLSHEMLVSNETGDLISTLESDGISPDSDEGATVRLGRRAFDQATKLPSKLVEERARATSLAQPAWVEARERSDWSIFAPHLEKLMDMQLQTAEYLGYDDHPYDALLDLFEYGNRKAKLEPMFDSLKASIVPLFAKVRAAAEAEGDPEGERREAPLVGDFPEAGQEDFIREVLTEIGYDWSRGRQDRVVHAFCINIGGPDDVRLTTNFDARKIDKALFTSMHESGHGMYEQGVSPEYSRTPLSGGVSMGVHESQSRLWENVVGRSRGFWGRYLPQLKAKFPGVLDDVDVETFYRAVNVSKPGFIRIDSDELTYNLHILLRFEMEVALIEGSISVSDVPRVWNEKMTEYLGITPPNDSLGALQDVHWSSGLFGYFPTYSMGNVLSMQFYETAVAEEPQIVEEAAEGKYTKLHAWMSENIYRHGSRYDPSDLVERVTGRPLDTAPYLNYLDEKFTDLYS